MKNLVLLHGALGAKQDMKALKEALKGDDLQVYSFSFSGHGKTAFAHDFGINRFCNELEDFIASKNIGNANVLGYSMGGYVALCLALRPSHSINSIITLGTKFDWSEGAVEKETKQLNPDVIRQKVPAFAKMLEDKHGKGWPDLLHKTSGMMKNIGRENLLNTDSVKHISVPVLIGLADRDQMVGLSETVEIYKALPNAAMFMLPATKHQIETVNVALLGRLIRNFMGL